MTRAARTRSPAIRTADQPATPESPIQRRADGFMVPSAKVKTHLDVQFAYLIAAIGSELAAT